MAEAIRQHISENFSHFVTLPHEQLLFVERQHWLILLKEYLFLVLLSIPFYGTAFFISLYMANNFLIFILSTLVICCINITMTVKIIIDWYCHMFIATNRKILEVWYSPLFFHKVNGVLLDQVRCTEIDEHESGMLYELLNMGNITITFDRPTHQEEFILKDIPHPEKTAARLHTLFASLDQDMSHPIWFKSHQNQSERQFFRRGGGEYHG